MQSKARFLLFSAVLIVVGVLSFGAGSVYGFAKGRSAQTYASSADAATSTLVLSLLRRGESDKGIELLELELGRQLIANTMGREDLESVFNPLWLLGIDSPETIDELARRGAEYWLEYHPVEDRGLVSGFAARILGDAASSRSTVSPREREGN